MAASGSNLRNKTPCPLRFVVYLLLLLTTTLWDAGGQIIGLLGIINFHNTPSPKIAGWRPVSPWVSCLFIFQSISTGTQLVVDDNAGGGGGGWASPWSCANETRLKLNNRASRLAGCGIPQPGLVQVIFISIRGDREGQFNKVQASGQVAGCCWPKGVVA